MVENGSVPGRGLFRPEMVNTQFSIEETLRALYSVLSFAGQLPRGAHVRKWLDSIVAVANLAIWTSRSPLALATLRIHRQLLSDLSLRASTICLQSTLNLWADCFSRERVNIDFALSRSVAQKLRIHFLRFRQLFANHCSVIVPLHAGTTTSPMSLGAPSTLTWYPGDSGDLLTPSPHWVGPILDRLQNWSDATIAIVVPDLPDQPWFAPAIKAAQLPLRPPFLA